MDQQINETNMSSLPPEMIEKIFELLTHRERLTASLVCNDWDQFAFSPKYCKKLWIRIDDRKLDLMPSLRDIRTYQKFRHAFVNLHNTKAEILSELADFIKTAPLETLEIHSYRICVKKILDDDLLCMNSLTKLIIRIFGGGPNPEDSLKIGHPNLKLVSICDRAHYERFEINCPNLIDLTLNANYAKNFHLVTQLQHQLQYLEFVYYKNYYIKGVMDTELSKLRKLWLTCGVFYDNVGPRFNLSFDKMVNLTELQLLNMCCDAITVGEQLGVLTSLSKLFITKIVLDAKGFEKALHKMVKLRHLELSECQFTESCHIASEHVENLYMYCKPNDCSVVSIHFPKLKRLSYADFFVKEIDDIFVHFCNIHPELENLSFASIYGKRKFRSPTSFSHISKLKFLKELCLGLDLDNINWMDCKDTKVVNLRLTNCTVEGNVAQRLVASIGPKLRHLSMNDCSLGMNEKCIQDLLKTIPLCKVSFKECTVSVVERIGLDNWTLIRSLRWDGM